MEKSFIVNDFFTYLKNERSSKYLNVALWENQEQNRNNGENLI